MSKKRKNNLEDTASSGANSSLESSSSSDSSDPSTDKPIVRPKKKKRTSIIYYKVKMYSPGGSNPAKLLQSLLRAWYKAVQACPDSYVIYEFQNKGRTKAITTKHNITSNIHFLKRFFLGIRLKTVPGDIWFTILAGYKETEDEHKENTDWWYRDNNSGIF